ncbi:unnamed protein product [Cuscuta epithymum]|uniref:Transmembrane protein n=1 Tax=Cuscuta epithymum TaxID=186058 RepID=A0AAV0CTA7_9ASTE|nr:unnamed protein product [Cuscuta epithymum]
MFYNKDVFISKYYFILVGKMGVLQKGAVMTCTGAALEGATTEEKAGTRDSAMLQVWGRKIIFWTISLEEEEEEEEEREKMRKRRNKKHRRPLNPRKCCFVTSFTILGGFGFLFLPLYELMIL